MRIINYISIISMPIIILLIVANGVKERAPIFDMFLKGAKDGIQIVIKIFPTLIGLFMAIGMLRSSGVIDFIVHTISPITNMLNIPNEIMPLAMLRPISGSASMAVATDIIKNNGVDTFIGIVASVIMGSTETTLYTIAVYTGSTKIKNTRLILLAALMADLTGILVAILVCKVFF
ncbi:MAG: spore maturation protein [Clostridia bacterium]|jgi:spore maturation protein B|nr:spore maturation protein [Clostridia bacterium]